MLRLLRKDAAPKPTPIADELDAAAKLLGIEGNANDFLGQAELIHELARRVVALERKANT
jgi:hypothetical protein